MSVRPLFLRKSCRWVINSELNCGCPILITTLDILAAKSHSPYSNGQFGWLKNRGGNVPFSAIDLGGTTAKTDALAAFAFIVAFFETIYVLVLHGGLFNPKFGVGYR